MSLRLYLDDDIVARQLIRLLKDARHDVVIPADRGLAGAHDPIHFAHAVQDGRVLLTFNARDFAPLHAITPGHPGVIVVRKDNDPSRDMTPGDIVRAIANVEAAGVPIAGEFIVLNAWRY